MTVYIVYNDDKQLKKIKGETFKVSPFFEFIDERKSQGKKEAWKRKSFWAAKMTPFVEIYDGPVVEKVFYSESGDAIEQLINYLNK